MTPVPKSAIVRRWTLCCPLSLCASSNPPSTYGGYIGYKRFFYNRIVSGVNGSEIPDSSASYSKLESVYCRDKMLDLPQ